MSCPNCKVTLEKKTVEVSKEIDLVCFQCPKCEGFWIDKPQMDSMKEEILVKVKRTFWAGKE